MRVRARRGQARRSHAARSPRWCLADPRASRVDAPITLSVVSHGHGALVADLLADVAARVRVPVEVLLTLNVPEPLAPGIRASALPVRVIANERPKGYGANHNAAFAQARGAFFCVMNPDLRLADDPFPPLLAALDDRRNGIAAPLVTDAAGRIEDSARRFPTVRSLGAKLLGGARALDYTIGDAPFFPDWVAGMFMLLRADTYGALGGFDERYFLYYEDVDLCRRLRARGERVVVVPPARVVHLARRASHRDLRHLRWHLGSAIRYLTRPPRELPPLHPAART